MKRSLRWALLLALFSSACKKQITSLPQGEELNGVRVELLGGRLHFNFREDFDNFFQLSKERKDNIIAEFNRHEFKSFKPAIKKDQSLAGSVGGCEIDEDQYNAAADFFSTLNTDAVVQIDNDLFKIDLCNQKVYVLGAADNSGNNYNDLVIGNTSNNKVGYFPMYVEATEAVAQGYRTMPDPGTVQDNESFRLSPIWFSIHEDKFILDAAGNKPGEKAYDKKMDGKVAFDSYAVWFVLYAKEKYQRQTEWLSDLWVTTQLNESGTSPWYVNYQYRYKRRGIFGSTQSGSGTLHPPDGENGFENKCQKIFYQGVRSLVGGSTFVNWDVWNTNIYRTHVYRGTVHPLNNFILSFDYGNIPTLTPNYFVATNSFHFGLNW